MIAKLLIHPLIATRVGEIEKILAAQELKKEHPDVLWLEEEKLGVEAAKKIRQHLSLKPYSAQGRAVVVLNTQVMTIDAQNSLLKTLEEPPTEAIILLGADSDKNILPTVLSRVDVIIIANPTGVKPALPAGRQSQGLNSKQSLPFLQKGGIATSAPLPRNGEIEELLKCSLEQRFELIEKLEDKEAFLYLLLEYFHAKLPTDPKYLEFTKELIQAEEWKEANGNIRAILEYLVLKLPD